MGCDEVKSEKYQTRKSPPYHAKNCKNLTKKGKNGEYVSKPDAKGIYKWTKVAAAGKTRKAPKGSKTYMIHDNGSHPYKVQVSGKTVEIYKGEYRRSLDNTKAINYNHMDYDKLIKKLTVKEVHVGKSPCIDMADWCGALTLGNTMLLHISGKKYMHIGHKIFEFTMDDDFEAYYSLIGNNDVPYPVLVGSKYVYFMLDFVTMPREAFKAKMSAAEWADAYRYYYGFKNLATGEKLECKQASVAARSKCMKERGDMVKQITKLYEKKMKGVKITK
jgi:hypothetical protein